MIKQIIGYTMCVFLVGCSSVDYDIPSPVMQRKIVYVKQDVLLSSMIQDLKTSGINVRSTLKKAHALVVEVPSNKVESIVNNNQVISVKDDIKCIVQPTNKKSIVLYSEQIPWGVERIGVSSVYTGYGVKVAVLDTGIDSHHPDLDGNVVGGFDFVNWSYSIFDDDGHGTHVAGTIGAEKNGYGVVGVAPNALLYSVKILDSNGDGYISDEILGIEWCIDHNIDVINISSGFKKNIIDETTFQELHNIIIDAYNRGITIVCSAGNNGAEVLYPASFPETIAVSALDQNNRLANFSNRGDEIDIAAPGVDIVSTVPNYGFDSYDGTSMSAPHVTGVVALMIQKNPNITPKQIREKLISSGTKISLQDTYFGSGRLVNAINSLK